ncbi:MAG: hypothetical protein ACTSO7_02915 [Candidatus Heimdallarchaeota archaeon]
MSVQDVIIIQEKLVKRINKIENAKCLTDDKNCELLLDFLLKGPMTFEDIKKAFIKVDEKKSDKTIYGYLNKLKKADLVMETGKRIVTYSESQIKTLTLYSRTAKVFYIALDLEGDGIDNQYDDYFNVLSKLMCEMMNLKNIDEKCFKKIYDEFIVKRRTDIEKLNEIENPEILDLLATFNSRGTKFVIDTLMWLTFINDKNKIYDELRKCFS